MHGARTPGEESPSPCSVGTGPRGLLGLQEACLQLLWALGTGRGEQDSSGGFLPAGADSCAASMSDSGLSEVPSGCSGRPVEDPAVNLGEG